MDVLTHDAAVKRLTGKAPARSKRERAPWPATARPWPCVVLAVDTAKQSGWAVYLCGQLMDSGEVSGENRGGLDAIVRLAAFGYAMDSSAVAGVVLVLERPWGGNRATVEGLGAARQAWIGAWKANGLPKRRVVRVYPATWRARVLGGRYASAKREVAQRAERAHANRIKGAIQTERDKNGKAYALTFGGFAGANEAPAICIGQWACRAAEVGKLLGKKAGLHA